MATFAIGIVIGLALGAFIGAKVGWHYSLIELGRAELANRRRNIRAHRNSNGLGGDSARYVDID